MQSLFQTAYFQAIKSQTMRAKKERKEAIFNHHAKTALFAATWKVVSNAKNWNEKRHIQPTYSWVLLRFTNPFLKGTFFRQYTSLYAYVSILKKIWGDLNLIYNKTTRTSDHFKMAAKIRSFCCFFLLKSASLYPENKQEWTILEHNCYPVEISASNRSWRRENCKISRYKSSENNAYQ